MRARRSSSVVITRMVAVLAAAAVFAAGCGSDGNSDSNEAEDDVAATFATVPPAASVEPTVATDRSRDGVDPAGSGAPTSAALPETTSHRSPPLPRRSSTRPSSCSRSASSIDRSRSSPGRRTPVCSSSNRADGSRAVDDESDEVVLDISDLVTEGGSEQGLLGLAFHPNADLAYVDYTDGSGDTVVAEYAVDDATGVFDPASARQVITVGQPFPNHNGGKVVFGPDGLLYIGLGDGGSADDPERNGLDLTTCSARSSASIRLRRRPTRTPCPPTTRSSESTVPTSGSGRSACATRGGSRSTRRPATCGSPTSARTSSRRSTTPRRSTGSMPGAGLSFGWSAFEGDAPFNDDQSADGHTAPVFEYSHADGGCSVSGGAVARDTTVPDLAGWYVFGDYCSGQIWALDPASTADAPRVVEIANLGGLAAISVGADGELYVISNGGTIARLVAP